MKMLRAFGASEGKLFPEGRISGPMPWVIAIMMFLTVLAAATGMALSAGAERIEGEINAAAEAARKLGDAEPARLMEHIYA